MTAPWEHQTDSLAQSNALGPAGLPQERAETQVTSFKPPGPRESLTCESGHTQDVATRPFQWPHGSLQSQTTMDPKLVTQLAFLSSPPDVNSWCNPRNNMDKFLACYFWQLLPPRKEGDYTVGYSGKLARRPQTRFLARTALMINPGHAEHSVLASEHVWKGQCCARQAAYTFRRCYLFIKSI